MALEVGIDTVFSGPTPGGLRQEAGAEGGLVSGCGGPLVVVCLAHGGLFPAGGGDGRRVGGPCGWCS